MFTHQQQDFLFYFYFIFFKAYKNFGEK